MKKQILKLITSLVVILGTLMSFSLVAVNATPAEDACKGLEGLVDSCTTPTELSTEGSSVVSQITTWLTYIAGAAAVIYLVLGAFKFITSGGNDKKVQSAKSTMLYAALGLALLVLINVIVKIVVSSANKLK